MYGCRKCHNNYVFCSDEQLECVLELVDDEGGSVRLDPDMCLNAHVHAQL